MASCGKRGQGRAGHSDKKRSPSILRSALKVSAPQSGSRASPSELSHVEEDPESLRQELEEMREKYSRLQSGFEMTQRLKLELEGKIQWMVEHFEEERKEMHHEISALTSQLMHSEDIINRLVTENVRHRREYQMMQCGNHPYHRPQQLYEADEVPCMPGTRSFVSSSSCTSPPPGFRCEVRPDWAEQPVFSTASPGQLCRDTGPVTDDRTGERVVGHGSECDTSSSPCTNFPNFTSHNSHIHLEGLPHGGPVRQLAKPNGAESSLHWPLWSVSECPSPDQELTSCPDVPGIRGALDELALRGSQEDAQQTWQKTFCENFIVESDQESGGRDSVDQSRQRMQPMGWERPRDPAEKAFWRPGSISAGSTADAQSGGEIQLGAARRPHPWAWNDVQRGWSGRVMPPTYADPSSSSNVLRREDVGANREDVTYATPSNRPRINVSVVEWRRKESLRKAQKYGNVLN
uniref:Uncharacterized protein n=1 Tax=Eptatretus burgeri TaxID=7764 RepID=A0A8C4Q472_EPTBU